MTDHIESEIEHDPRDQQKFVFHITAARRLTISFLKMVLPLFMKREISGADHLPLEGPVVLASNHLTNFDVFPIQLCLPRPLFLHGRFPIPAQSIAIQKGLALGMPIGF